MQWKVKFYFGLYQYTYIIQAAEEKILGLHLTDFFHIGNLDVQYINGKYGYGCKN